MHPNLSKIQSLVIQGVKDFKAREMARPCHPEILAALVLAEKPLSVREVVQRTDVPVEEAEKFVFHLLDQGVVAQCSKTNSDGSRTYEMNQALEEVIPGMIKSRLESFLERMEDDLTEAEHLLESGRNEFDAFDTLYSRLVGAKVRGLRLVNRAVRRRALFWESLQDPAPAASCKPKKVEIK